MLAEMHQENLIREMERELTIRSWKHDVNHFGEVEYTSPSGDWQVQISDDGWWALCSFTDSDMEAEWGLVAVGRYVSKFEGNTLAELQEALAEAGIK